MFVNVAREPLWAAMSPSTVYDKIESITRRHRDVLPEKWSPHWLRHTHATALLLAGVPPHVVMRRLGHADYQTTLDAYGWVTEDAELRTLRVALVHRRVERSHHLTDLTKAVADAGAASGARPVLEAIADADMHRAAAAARTATTWERQVGLVPAPWAQPAYRIDEAPFSQLFTQNANYAPGRLFDFGPVGHPRMRAEPQGQGAGGTPVLVIPLPAVDIHTFFICGES